MNPAYCTRAIGAEFARQIGSARRKRDEGASVRRAAHWCNPSPPASGFQRGREGNWHKGRNRDSFAAMHRSSGLRPGRGEGLTRDIASAITQIDRNVAQNIDQLKPLAKANAVAQQCLVTQLRLWKKMGAAEVGPELPDASRHAVGVVIQFGIAFQGGQLRKSGRAGNAGDPVPARR